ncbi:MAG TPA: large-conductance mechanosensitive channel protein MscL [Candidatus Paceibacterota bacterium]|jgi:large conductance mechanosensitive channel|nr:large-conductance mechanosensitive channel protein MscL [Candidatus Paceibacterota bacterium]HRZ29494.1 large-conductance mechanosensitive channel protein MscL [Candidatus Paceibacterota bacterium]
MKKLLQEFKEFAMKGNVMDLATAVIIGGAFGKIVSSLVADIIMPIIGLLTSGKNFNDIKIVLREASLTNPAVTMNIGLFIQNIIDFIIIAFSIFMMIKMLNQLQKKFKKEEEKKETIIESSKEEQLLTEIRDLLKKN